MDKENKVYCHDCGKEIKDIEIDEKNQKVTGAKFYERDGNWYVKCLDCFAKDPVLRNFQKSLCYSRVVGFLTPVNQWNLGKKSEFEQRKVFNAENALNDPNKNKNKTVV